MKANYQMFSFLNLSIIQTSVGTIHHIVSNTAILVPYRTCITIILLQTEQYPAQLQSDMSAQASSIDPRHSGPWPSHFSQQTYPYSTSPTCEAGTN